MPATLAWFKTLAGGGVGPAGEFGGVKYKFIHSMFALDYMCLPWAVEENVKMLTTDYAHTVLAKDSGTTTPVSSL